MKIATTTEDFVDYFGKQEDRVKALYDAGFRYIDLSLYNVGDMNYFMGEDWQEKADRLLDFAYSLGMKFVQSHAPGKYGNPAVFDDNYDTVVKTTIRAIEVCERLGIENTVVHTGRFVEAQYDLEGKKLCFERNAKFIRDLIDTMEKTNVNVLVENGYLIEDNAFTLVTGAEMKEFIEYVNHPLLHACWDTGHANIAGVDQYKQIIDLGDDLRALHINDNSSRGDEHTLPYTASVNMDSIMCGLIDSGYKGYFTFESGYTLRNHYIRRTFDKDTRLFKTPLCLQQDVEKLFYKTGKYILDAYDCFEE